MSDPSSPSTTGTRDPGHPRARRVPRAGDGTRRAVHDAPGQAGGRGPGGRRVRAVPADPDALLQHRRRRRGGDLARGHPLLHGAVRRGTRPGRALPRADDAAVRDRGAADRAVPGPLRARPPLGDRRDDGDPGLPGLGARRRRRHRVAVALPGRPRRTRRVQGVRRHARRRRTPAAPPRLHAGQGQRPGVDVGHRRRRGVGTARRARLAGRTRSGCCATRSCSSSPRPSRRSGCRRGSTPARARATCCCAGRRGPGPPGQRPDPAGGRLRAAGQLRTAVAVGLPDHVHGVPAAREPDRRLEHRGPHRARRRRRRGAATSSA